MPTLLYNLELTQDEILHLWTLLEMRSLSIQLQGTEEDSMLAKVKELMGLNTEAIEDSDGCERGDTRRDP